MGGVDYPVTFLFDSGATVSLTSVDGTWSEGLPENKDSRVNGVGGKQAVGQAQTCSFVLDCLPKKVFQHPLKPTKIPGEPALVLLGTDFLSKFDEFRIDWANHRMKLGTDWVYTASQEETAPILDVEPSLSPSQKSAVEELLHAHSSLFVHNPRAPREATIATHVIKTNTSLPHKDKVRRTPVKWKDIVEVQLQDMEENGIIQASESPYSSNILLTSKKDGTRRFCCDFRTLNKSTIKDTYPLPSVEDIFESFKGCCYFSQADLASGYWGIPVNPEDVDKTAFATHKGKFEFLRMPFGLCNAQATFQRAMDGLKDRVHKEGHPGMAAYVDNIVIYSRTWDEHLAALTELCHQAKVANLSLRADKCEFAKPEIEFLGYIHNGKTIRPTSENVDKVKAFPVPATRRQLQRFLGMCNFNRRFVPNYAAVAAPLSRLTSSKVKFEWGTQEEAAFQSIKQHLQEAPNLYLADWNREFNIETDASKTAIGAVLFQIDDNGNRLHLGYHSKALSQVEQRWTTTELEMYAIVCASRKWSAYCSNKVVFHTDHQPLKYIRKQKDPRGKIARWIMELENFDYTVEYIPGKDNHEADYLSRIVMKDEERVVESMQESAAIYCIQPEIPTVELIQKHQEQDRHIKDARTQLESTGGITKGIFRSHSNIELREKLLWKGTRIIIPHSLQEQIIREYHGQHHPGKENTCLLIKARFYWRGMEKQVERFVRACRTCIQCKVARVQHSSAVIPKKVKPCEKLGIDIACMPQSSRGKTYILQMIDQATKFVSTAALSDQQAETIKQALWPKWFCYFGIPNTILSDQGSNVDGKVIRDLCRKLNITKIHSSPYHPEGNASTERSIGSVKTLIRSMCQARGIRIQDWDLLLDEATLAYNATVNKSMGISPFECMLGVSPQLTVDQKLGLNPRPQRADIATIRANAEKNREEAQGVYRKRLDDRANTQELKVGDRVLLKRNFGEYPKISVKWKEDSRGEPYTIVKTIGPVNYGIQDSAGKQKVYHRNMLKPAGERKEAASVPESQAPGVPLVRPTPLSVHVPSSSMVGPTLVDSVNQQEFTTNVFRRDQQAPMAEVTASQETASPHVTRSGRTSKPVRRYGID